jgi:hypothetical protein
VIGSFLGPDGYSKMSNSEFDESKRIVLPPGKYFLIGREGGDEVTDYYSLTPRERWLLHLPQLKSDEDNGEAPPKEPTD